MSLSLCFCLSLCGWNIVCHVGSASFIFLQLIFLGETQMNLYNLFEMVFVCIYVLYCVCALGDMLMCHDISNVSFFPAWSSENDHSA